MYWSGIGGLMWELCECQAEFGYMLLVVFEHSYSKIYSEDVYLTKSFKAANSQCFFQKPFSWIKHTTTVLPVLFVFSLKPFACLF